MDHYNQPRRRKAEFIKPPNVLKKKVGAGGLSDDILDKAQQLLENHTVDFEPLADLYLTNLMKGVESVKNATNAQDNEYLISNMLYPAMQLKANGGMFHYPLITMIADKLIQFLEVIETIDIEVVEIVLAFHTTMRAVIQGRIKGDGGQHGQALIKALDAACMRYFSKGKTSGTV
ncbi:MAG: hypothetical protein ACPGRX_03585 [Bdellovibrionales bacterium]